MATKIVMAQLSPTMEEGKLLEWKVAEGDTIVLDRQGGDVGDQINFERVLLIQAEQSLRSAESGYAAGNLNSLDLLDAERVLLEVRTGIERARTDHAIALARLEGAIGAPLDTEGASQ